MIALKKIIPFSFIIFLFDRFIKFIITSNINLNTSIIVIKNFFNITYVRNYGAAFSILYGNRIFLIFVSLVAVFLIYLFFIKGKNFNKIDIIIYSLLFGGIFGNLFDRIVYGYVIDFFDFYIFNYNFPIFNIADVCIVVSMFLIILDSIRGEKNADNSRK